MRQDEPVPEAAHQGLHRGGADLWKPSASDAWVCARPDVAADVPHPLRALLADAGAGKSVDLVPDGRVQDAFPVLPPELWARAEPDAAAVLCKQAVVQSAEQSCAEQGVGGPAAAERLPRDEPHSSEVLRAARKQSSRAQTEQAALLPRPEMAREP